MTPPKFKMFSSLSTFSWADAVESAVEADLAQTRQATRRGAATSKAEFDLLAETSRDGLNLLFKQVVGLPSGSSIMEQVRAETRF